MELPLDGRAAIVTGASSGMGAATARRLAAAGAHVALVGRDREKLTAIAEDIVSAGGQAHEIRADLTAPDAGQAVVREALEVLGGLQVLVHAAGVFEFEDVEDGTVEGLDRQWAINVRAPFALTQAALPHLAAGSSVIFVTSVAAHVGTPGCTAYSATKGALRALARSYAVGLASRGIRVNTIAPGEVATPMNAGRHADPKFLQDVIDGIPAGRVGHVDDIAAAVAFLASGSADFICGAELVIDGGYSAQ